MILRGAYQLLRILLALLVTLCCSLLIPACSYFNKTHSMAINIRAGDYLNPNIHGHSEPVVVSIYQLKSAQNFADLDYQQLQQNTQLKKQILDRHQIEIQPQQLIDVSSYLQDNVTAIAIVAAFRDIEQATWRQLITLKPDQKPKKLSIQLSTLSLTADLT